MQLDRKRILVVGGSSGIGFAVADAALSLGADVTIASSNPGKLADAARRLGEVATARLDLTDEAMVEAYFDSCAGFDHIVCTAGDWPASRRTLFRELDLKAAESLFRLRFWGSVILARYGCRALAQDGSIVLTGGMTAHKPAKGSAIGTALAGSIEYLTRGLAVELAPARVNAVCPGPTSTEAIEAFPMETRNAISALLERSPLPRLATAGEVAEAYLYLMRGTYTTGQVLLVEGGWSISG